jgi:trigger factor
VKSTVEQLSPTRVKIDVEVPFDELKPNFDRAYRKIAQQVNIPGFRPGKAPARILEQRLGRGVVLEEVVSEAVPAKYAEIVSANKVYPLGRPEIEVTKIEDGDHLAFTAQVDVRPEIEMPAFNELAVSVDDIEVTDAEVDEQLDGLRSRFGTLTAVERTVQQGDLVSLDLSATVDGEEVPDLATSDLSYEIGSGQLIEGIDDALIGATQGDERVVTAVLAAGEKAGQQAQVTAKIQAVKERELPAADDEFAQLASEFDTLDELRADLRTRLGRVKAMQQGAQARDNVLKALLEATEVPLPESVVESEFESRKHDALHAFDHDEKRLGRWLEQQGHTREDFETDLRNAAQETVKVQLLLDAIADAEELSVTDSELSERIVYQAQRHGVSPNEYAMKLHDAGELSAVYADVRRGKALAGVVSQAAVTDATGNPVDIDALIASATPEHAASVR